MFDVSPNEHQNRRNEATDEAIWTASSRIIKSFSKHDWRACRCQSDREKCHVGWCKLPGGLSRSRAEFASKIGIVAEEADESLYWLEVIAEGKIVPLQKVAWLLKEADELTAIFTSARRSASQPQPSKIRPQTSNS